MDDRKEICDAYRMVEGAVETRMEALRKRLLQVVKVDAIVTYKDLSLALGQNPTFVQQFVTKRTPKRLYDEQVEIIENMIADRSAERSKSAAASAPSHLRDVLRRLEEYPGKIQDRVVSFAEFEMARYDKSLEKETKSVS